MAAPVVRETVSLYEPIIMVNGLARTAVKRIAGAIECWLHIDRFTRKMAGDIAPAISVIGTGKRMSSQISVFDGHNDVLLRLYRSASGDAVSDFLNGEDA